MQAVLTSYSTWWNVKYHQVGHVFQGRYHSKICDTDQYLHTLIHYVHLNAVEADLAQDANEWPWSSAQAYLQRPVPWVATERALGLLDENRDVAIQKFQAILQSGLPKSLPETRDGYIGSPEFVRRIKSMAPQTPPKSPAAVPSSPIPFMQGDQLLSLICRLCHVSLDDIKSKSHQPRLVEIRRALAEATRRWWGWNNTQAARLLNISPVAVLKLRRQRSAREEVAINRLILQWETEIRRLQS